VPHPRMAADLAHQGRLVPAVRHPDSRNVPAVDALLRMNPSAASGLAPLAFRRRSRESRFTRESLPLPRAAGR
jgi:hypothetical protein